jgi:hypothetical protein
VLYSLVVEALTGKKATFLQGPPGKIVEEGSGIVSRGGYFRFFPKDRLHRVGISFKVKNQPVNKDEHLYSSRGTRAKFSIAL